MSSSTTIQRVGALSVAVALIARALYWWLVTPEWIPRSDADQYLQIARNLADGDGYSLIFPQLELHATAFRPPLYPAILSVPAWLFGPDVLWPSRLLSLLLGLAVVAAVVWLVGRIASPTAALVTGLLVALYPPLIANDTVTLTEPLALLLLVLLLIALDTPRPCLAGLLAGLILLTRPNAYLVVLVAALAVWRLVGWRKAAACVGVALVVVSPWAIRNQIEMGSPRLTTSEGFTIAAIYAPAAQGAGAFVDPVFSPAYDGDGDVRLSQFDEAAWNDRLMQLGIDTLADNPDYLVDVVTRNGLSYLELSTTENEVAERLDGRNLGFRAATLPLFYVVTLLGAAGLLSNWRRPQLWPAMLIVAQFAVLSLLLVAPPRLRGPFDLLMCIGVGLFVDRALAHRSPPVDDSAESPELSRMSAV